MTATHDRPITAAASAVQMRDGLRRLRSTRLHRDQRTRLRVATRRAVIGVLHYSAAPAELKVAGEVLRMLEVERHADRLRRDAEALRAQGATISDRQITTAATELGEASASLELHECDRRRIANGLEGL